MRLKDHVERQVSRYQRFGCSHSAEKVFGKESLTSSALLGDSMHKLHYGIFKRHRINGVMASVIALESRPFCFVQTKSYDYIWVKRSIVFLMNEYGLPCELQKKISGENSETFIECKNS